MTSHDIYPLAQRLYDLIPARLRRWTGEPGEADGATLLNHVAQAHPREVGRYLDQMHTDDDITPATLQAYEEVEAPAP
jgi:hypothetical protein